jgi:hypothetical protein
MRTLVICIATLLFSSQGFCQKPRIVISSDFPPLDVIPGTLEYGSAAKRSDPDDVQSMVRFLVYSNEFDILGLIAASGTLANVANKQHILDIIHLYDQVDNNLRRHDRAFPLPDALRKVTKNGLSGTYARPWQEIIGEGKDSEASVYLIDLLKQPHTDPLWFCFWGGTQELAQALWRMRKELKDAQLTAVLAKIRVFMIAQQDGTGQWLIDNFPQLQIIVHNSFKGFFFDAADADTTMGNLPWINKNIRYHHGPLGRIYPQSGWDHTRQGVVEGDTPSFLYLLSGAMGLSDSEKPWYGGWGGRFQQDRVRKNLWIDAEEGEKALTRWLYARQNDFEARMDWCVKGPRKANHNPIVSVNNNRTKDIIYLKTRPGERVSIRASGSVDPDGNTLSYSLTHYKEASTYKTDVNLPDGQGPDFSFTIPKEAAASEIHLVLEVTDNGFPKLSSFRRIVITVDQ